jgi:hypothetical protein
MADEKVVPDPKPDAAKVDTGAATGKEPAPKETPKDEFEIKFGEGVQVDPEVLGSFKTIAKEAGLKGEHAQKLADLAAKNMEGVLKAQQDQWAKQREAWANEIKADKDFGGQKFNETVERAKRALGKFGEAGLVEFLDQTGYGDNPALIRLLARVDRALGEDKVLDGAPPEKDTRSAAEVLYGKS